MSNADTFNKDLADYRSLLLHSEQKSQEQYDKAVLALSGGALGLSFAFVADFLGEIPPENVGYLIGAWAAWIASVTCVLASFYTSQQALRKAVKQVDEGSIYKYPAGGRLTSATACLNAAGGILFLIGVTLLLTFVMHNI